MRPFIVTAAFCLLAASCGPLWDRANRIPFQEDVAEVLSAAGTHVVLTDCHMEGTTRTGHCAVEGGSQVAATIAASLKMGDPRVVGVSDDSLLPTFLRDSGCIPDYPPDVLDEVLAYLVSGRPDQLRLADGGQFEYFLITTVPTQDTVCLQASYAYG
jgi:hypothetical protein